MSTVLLPAICWLIPLPDDMALAGRLAIWLIPLLLLGTCALFTVRGYELVDDEMHVQRLLWRTRIPLRTLTDAEWRHGSFGWAIRTCGNGGLYSFTGWYYQKSIGSFRALGTRTIDAVILKFRDCNPIVITPNDPDFRRRLDIESRGARLGEWDDAVHDGRAGQIHSRGTDHRDLGSRWQERCCDRP